MPMNTITNNPEAPELNYSPPRVVSFGWMGEAFTLFGAKPGLWIVATLVAFLLPFLVLLLLDFLLGDPMQTFSGGTPTKTGQWVLFIGIELVSFVASAFFYGALFRLAVQQVRGVPVTARDIFRGGRVFGPMAGFTLLFLLAVLGLEIVCFAPALAETYLHLRALTFGGPNPSLPNTWPKTSSPPSDGSRWGASCSWLHRSSCGACCCPASRWWPTAQGFGRRSGAASGA